MTDTAGQVSTAAQTEDAGTATGLEWLTVPDLSEIMDSTPARVRRLIEEDHLVAVRRDGVLVVPAKFIKDGEPLAHLRGTITVLRDSGFTTEEIVSWITEPNDLMAMSPVDALREGRRAEVRRVAQSLAY